MFQIVGSFPTFTFQKVATRLRCGGIFNDSFITRLLVSDSERILKIGQHLPKLWSIIYKYIWVVFFMKHGVCVTTSNLVVLHQRL